QKIEWLVSAAGLQKQAATHRVMVPADFFYAFGRAGLPTNLAALGLKSRQEGSKALQQALNENILSAGPRDQLDGALDQLQTLAVDEVLRTPLPGGKQTLNELLGIPLPSRDQRVNLISLAANHTGTPEEFWTQVRALPAFQPPGLLEKLQLTL